MLSEEVFCSYICLTGLLLPGWSTLSHPFCICKSNQISSSAPSVLLALYTFPIFVSAWPSFCCTWRTCRIFESAWLASSSTWRTCRIFVKACMASSSIPERRVPYLWAPAWPLLLPEGRVPYLRACLASSSTWRMCPLFVSACLLLYLKDVSHICERLPGLRRDTARHNLHGLGQEADLTGNV